MHGSATSAFLLLLFGLSQGSTCRSSFFGCGDGRCIPAGWQCDGEYDCGDYSDERNCGSSSTCSSSNFRCDDDSCIPAGWRCDGEDDCGDYSDERNCGSSSTCRSSNFMCDDGRCIPAGWRCDGEDDCGDYSDERNCGSSSTCSSSNFRCEDGRCIPAGWRCDSEDDCGDYSDERNCSSSSGSGGSAQCGYKPSSRIVGGTEAPKGAWPWQAQLRNNNGFTFCGGTLVAPQWIVTAAHCVPGRHPSSLKIRLGAHYRNGNVGTEQDFEVEKIISHQSYNRPYETAHDIAMVKLKNPAILNRAVNLACLPGSSGSVSDGTMCWVTGFGTLAPDGSMPTVLMQVSVPVVSQASCRNAYAASASIHDSMVCAGLDQGGKDSCQGDSGGPMVCESNGKFFLEGVVSWGIGCASPGKYGVYSRVRYLRQWIADTINQN